MKANRNIQKRPREWLYYQFTEITFPSKRKRIYRYRFLTKGINYKYGLPSIKYVQEKTKKEEKPFITAQEIIEGQKKFKRKIKWECFWDDMKMYGLYIAIQMVPLGILISILSYFYLR